MALETSNLDQYYGVNYKICLKFTSHYGVDPKSILSVPSGQMQILLGLDTGELLMDKIRTLKLKELEDGNIVAITFDSSWEKLAETEQILGNDH